MSLVAKLHPVDDFWDERAQEQKARRRLESEMGNLQGAIGLSEKMVVLKVSPGWEDYQKALMDCLEYRRQELVLADSDRDMRLLQGRCRELSAIISLMMRTESNTQQLASRLELLQKERDAYMPDGKIIPKGAVS